MKRIAIGSIGASVLVLGGIALGVLSFRQPEPEAVPRRGAVVFLGDSLTARGSWPELLGRDDVLNRGVGGDRTADVLGRLDGIVELEPRQIFLLVGVNDVNRGVDPRRTRASYAKILDALAERLPNTKVVVQSLLPVGAGSRPGRQEAIRALNREIERLAVQRRLGFLDLHPVFADEKGRLRADLTNDGLHLLEPGYALWRDQLASFLVPADE